MNGPIQLFGAQLLAFLTNKITNKIASCTYRTAEGPLFRHFAFSSMLVRFSEWRFICLKRLPEAW